MKAWKLMLGAWRYGFRTPDKPPKPNPAGNVGGEIIPDRISTEPLEGHRVWRVVNSGQGLRLGSMHQSYIWAVDNTAACESGMQFFALPVERHPGVLAPALDCSCGLYAQLPDKPLREWQQSGAVIATGRIAMTGRVIRCERGFKAQHARILDVTLDATCHLGCDVPPVWVLIPEPGRAAYWTSCDKHKNTEPSLSPSVPRVAVELAPWMRQACSELSAHYQLEVVSYA